MSGRHTRLAVNAKSSLRPDLHRTQLRLDGANEGAVEIDPQGAAWQHSRGFWYRAYDSDTSRSSWELAQMIGGTE